MAALKRELEQWGRGLQICAAWASERFGKLRRDLLRGWHTGGTLASRSRANKLLASQPA